MARPKYSEQDISARERIENAFWQLMEESSYSQITIKALAWKAEVNHNLIYYYFENIEDVAQKCFDEILQKELPEVLLSGFTEEGFSVSDAVGDNFFQQLKRARLFAGSESPLLVGMFKNGIRNIWLTQIGKTEEDLTDLDRYELDFIFSGLTSVIGSVDIKSSPEVVSAFMQDSIGKGMMETLAKIKNE